MQTIRTGFIGGRLAAFILRAANPSKASPSDFVAERFDALPIRRLAWLANPLTREFTTARVRCELVPRPAYEVARTRIA
jgi:hypothetical protein